MQNFLPIGTEHIDLWLINPLEYRNSPLLSEFYSLLDSEEIERVERYFREESRHDALVTRAFIRTLLSYYTTGPTYVPPSDWLFDKGEKGKPELADSPLPLRFNLSHTDGLIVCAVTLRTDIGVDVEYVQRNTRFINIANHKFSPAEIASLHNTPESMQRSLFFDYWTLKESYIKAIGLGLSVPLDQFSFEINHYDDIRINFTDQLDDCGDNWQSWLMDASSEHRLALSINSHRSRVWQRRIFTNAPLEGFKPASLPVEL